MTRRARNLRIGVWRTAWGWMAAEWTERGIRRLVLPRPTKRAALRALGNGAPGGKVRTPPRRPPFAAAFARYLAGGPVPDLRVDLPESSPFARAVYRALRRIPYGATRTYGEVARAVRRPGAARAVGQVLGKNPVPILVPCHRVVAASGLGGFTGGQALKRKLLALERGKARAARQGRS